MQTHQLALVAGKKDDPFANRLAEYLGMRLVPVYYTEFPGDAGPMSGETKVVIRENIRGMDVCVVWSIEYTNYELMFVLQLIDAAALSSEARRVSLICPELPCARQDKTHERRESLSSRLVARLLEAAGCDDVLTTDLHSDQIEGHFRIPLDHLRTRPVWADYIAKRYKEWVRVSALAPDGSDLVLGVPDAGRARAVRELSHDTARVLANGGARQIPSIRLAHHDKHRHWESIGQVASHGLLGDVRGKVVWFTDDLLASGSTLFEAAKSAKEAGACHVVCSVTHAHGHDIADRPFAKRLARSAIDELVVTDTHPRFLERLRTDPLLAERTTCLSLVPLFGEAIRRIRLGQTIKEMMRIVDDYGILYRVVHEATDRRMPDPSGRGRLEVPA